LEGLKFGGIFPRRKKGKKIYIRKFVFVGAILANSPDRVKRFTFSEIRLLILQSKPRWRNTG